MPMQCSLRRGGEFGNEAAPYTTMLGFMLQEAIYQLERRTMHRRGPLYLEKGGAQEAPLEVHSVFDGLRRCTCTVLLGVENERDEMERPVGVTWVSTSVLLSVSSPLLTGVSVCADCPRRELCLPVTGWAEGWWGSSSPRHALEGATSIKRHPSLRTSERPRCSASTTT